MKLLVTLLAFLAPVCKTSTDWKPVLQPELFSSSLKVGRHFSTSLDQGFTSALGHAYPQPGLLQAVGDGGGSQCDLYKVGFTQDLYFQYVQYKLTLPVLKELTLCHWSKFSNHTNDHPIFSYAVDGQPRAVYSWIANTNRSSYFSLAIEGHTLYRLNYPLRLNRWYHTCQSWNGRTGEWQIWVNAERVGRGFHNRLVGHHIPSGGIAITGQTQTQYGGGFLEGAEAPKGSGGMLGEVTMVQLYSVALTAGKAHRDHKHHHAHTFDHNGLPITTTPRPPSPPRPPAQTHPLITGGQLNPNIALSIASGQPQPLPVPQQLFAGQQSIIPGQSFDAQLLNGQFTNSLILPQYANVPQSRGPQLFIAQDPITGQRQASFFAPQQAQQQPLLVQQQQQLQQQPPQQQTLVNSGLVHPSLVNPANVQFIDSSQLDAHQIFKRDDSNKNKSASKEATKSDGEKKTSSSARKGSKSSSRGHTKVIEDFDIKASQGAKKQTKRELYFQDGELIETGDLSSGVYDKTFLSGLATIGQNQPVLQIQKQNDEREPAEAEVQAVMNLCTGCDEEPFAKALVFGWRTVQKKLYSGAFYTLAVPRCKAF